MGSEKKKKNHEKKNYSKTKKVWKKIKKFLLPFSLILNIFSLIAGLYAIPEYYLTKDALVREQKENAIQMEATYLMCDLDSHMLSSAHNEYYNFHIVSNDISKLYKPIIELTSDFDQVDKIEEVLDIHNKGENYDYKVVYLYLESFGSHNVKDLCVDTTILCYEENFEHSEYSTPRFCDYPETEQARNYTFELENRKAGEKLLIPLLIEYGNYCGEEPEDPTSYSTYVYKEIYKPNTVRYTDGVTGERFELEVRDILTDEIEIDLHFIDLG